MNYHEVFDVGFWTAILAISTVATLFGGGRKEKSPKNGKPLITVLITYVTGEPADHHMCYSPDGRDTCSVDPAGYARVPQNWGGVSIKDRLTLTEITFVDFPETPPEPFRVILKKQT